ncbi:MAG: selenocysteine-specific translation elongation factor [Vicinamibacteraceae bacterium]|nr:selenocysteine-specific translation elongation factor [Vicinamibacteraceae bacterium]
MRHVVVGTAGHIDHGKSTLVLALTGTDPDRLKEEKARGITIDLGFAHLALDDAIELGFVDVPGHERFVKNMLAGASGIDLVLLVVAADESVMPQTREHFAICRLLGVERGIIALTKADLVDRDTVALVGLEVKDLVTGSFLESAPVVPVSARTGEGLDALRAALAGEARALERRSASGLARLPIDRVFSVRGFGTVVTGTLVSGALAVDDELEIAPGGRRVKVRAVQVHGRAAPAAYAGQRVAVNLAGVDVEEIARGQTLAWPASLAATRRFDARLDLLPDAPALRHGARVRVHCGTSEVLGRVSLGGVAAPASGEAALAVAAALPPGGRAYVRLRLEAPVAVTRGDRFIVRSYSPLSTIGGGVVLDPLPERGGIRTAAGHARFRAWDLPGHGGALAALVADRGLAGVSTETLVARLGLGPDEVRTLAADACAGGGVRAVGPWLVAGSALDTAARTLLALVATHHEQEPLSEGLPREEARTRLFARVPEAVFQQTVDDLVSARRLVGRERLALPTHRVTLGGSDDLLERVAGAFAGAGLTPADPGAIAAALGADRRRVDEAVMLLTRQRRLVRLDTLLFDAAALERLKAGVRAFKRAGEDTFIDVAAVKERFGLSRKYAIPLLEYLDRERVTRRVGDRRLVL